MRISNLEFRMEPESALWTHDGGAKISASPEVSVFKSCNRAGFEPSPSSNLAQLAFVCRTRGLSAGWMIFSSPVTAQIRLDWNLMEISLWARRDFRPTKRRPTQRSPIPF